MLDANEIKDKRTTLERLFAQNLHEKNGTLARRLKRSRHKLPKKSRKVVDEAVQMLTLAENPKLAVIVDRKKLDFAYERAIETLSAIDPNDWRKGLILGTLGSIVFNLLLFFGIVVFLLWYFGAL